MLGHGWKSTTGSTGCQGLLMLFGSVWWAASAASVRLAAQSCIHMPTLIGNPKQQFSQGCQSLNRVWVSGRIKLASASIGHHEGRFDSQGAVHRDVSSDHLKSCEEVLSGLIV